MGKSAYVFWVSAVLLLSCIISGHALSANISSLEGLSSSSLLSSEELEVTIIQFPDPNFEAAVRKVIEKPAGIITTADVAMISFLDISESNIKDLTGIECFVALAGLDCSVNELATLDVSKNPAMERLICYSNFLTTLDLSHNPLLKELDCAANLLTTLDMSHNTALKSLVCSGNQLAMLNVGHNAELEKLYCEDNSLATLDVRQNTALTELDCGLNALTMLDVSQNPMLELLFCYDNSLTILDVSQNPTLKDLSCNNNDLMALDVSQNPVLKGLSIKGITFPDRSAIIGLDEDSLEYLDYDQIDLFPGHP